MNIKEYISSGIIESYVLGMANDAERAEFERMCDMYPEVKAARESFEIAFEQETKFNQLQPPANLKSKIFSEIDIDASISRGRDWSSGVATENESNTAARPGVDLQPTKIIKINRRQRYLSAAAVTLLLLSTALNFYFFNRSKYYSEQYRDLLAQQTQIVSNNQILQTRMLEYEKAMEIMKDTNMMIVKMPSIATSPDPTSATTVYWNTITKDVFLTINQLPVHDENHQYQLWAMVDGKPVDAGVIDMKSGPGMVKMKNIPRAQAFAITLEKKGGSPTPSLDKLYVMGKV